jgi:hypothetical protein
LITSYLGCTFIPKSISSPKKSWRLESFSKRVDRDELIEVVKNEVDEEDDEEESPREESIFA